MPTLRTPTYDENMWTNSRLFSRYKLARGTTLLVKGTVVTEATYPYQEDIQNPNLYDHVYLGGHEYELTPDQVTILTNAGYGDFIH